MLRYDPRDPSRTIYDAGKVRFENTDWYLVLGLLSSIRARPTVDDFLRWRSGCMICAPRMQAYSA